jgi:hypothetical protein
MRIYLVLMALAFLAFEIHAEETQSLDQALSSAVKEYQSLQKELDSSLKNKSPDCSPLKLTDPKRSYCSIKDLCSNPQVQSDNPFIYQNEKGEKIVNDNYYETRDRIKSCLKEKFSDEIKQKRDELAQKLGYEHLSKIMAANKKLTQLTSKFNEGAKIQKISSEILTMSLESGLKGESAQWSDKSSNRLDLNAYITTAEKRSKTKLNSEIKKTLIELQYLKQNDLYTEQLDKLENDLLPNTGMKDALYDFRLLTDEKAAGGASALAANRARLAKKTQDAYAIFQETQKEMLEYLESIKNTSNASKIDRIIERIKTVKFNPPRLTKTLLRVCQIPNAFYSPGTHSFTVCPQMLDYPKMAIMETMAHELAHSFDSCNMSGKFYKIKGPSVVEEAPFEIEIATTPVLGNFRNTGSEDPQYLDPKNRLQDKMMYADNPFSKTLSCLQSPLSVGALSVDLGEMKVKANEKLAELTRIGQNTVNNAEARGLNYFVQNQDEYFKYFQGCDSSDSGADHMGRSQMQEAFADKISSEIMARKLKNLSQEEAQKSFIQITLGYGHVCTNEASGETKLRRFAIKEGCPDYLENMTNETRIVKNLGRVDPRFDSHPDTSKRIERNHLAHPDILKALNCPTVPGVKYCE